MTGDERGVRGAPSRECDEARRADRTVGFGTAIGLHARPAAVIARAAQHAQGHEVRVGLVNGEAIDAGSILALLGLGVEQGTPIRVEVVGPRCEAIADQFATLLAGDLDRT